MLRLVLIMLIMLVMACSNMVDYHDKKNIFQSAEWYNLGETESGSEVSVNIVNFVKDEDGKIKSFLRIGPDNKSIETFLMNLEKANEDIKKDFGDVIVSREDSLKLFMLANYKIYPLLIDCKDKEISYNLPMMKININLNKGNVDSKAIKIYEIFCGKNLSEIIHR